MLCINRMSHESKGVKLARSSLIQQTLAKIRETRDFRDLKRNTFVVLAHLWLHNIAKEEGLFKLDEWEQPKFREQLIEKIEIFLIKHIR
jgi:hypothetical protein